MDKLSDRMMALEGPDREIFLAAYTACYPNGGTPWASDACHKERFELLVDKEAWLSAAEMLVPEGWSVGLGDLRGYDPIIWRAHLRDHNNPDEMKREWVEGHAATSALALGAAVLKARGL